MYSATFTFIAKEFDDEFYELDKRIAEAAKQIPGYLGEEAWENKETGKVSTTYYWESLDALQQLVNDPNHKIAKRLSDQWLEKYFVTISQIIKSYGNPEISFSGTR
jgi:heme-degrading monooxygenase HmoA